MNSNTVIKTAEDMKWLYETTIELYQNYFLALEATIKNTPLSEVEKLIKLHALAQEASQALEDDLALFEKAIFTDAEDLKKAMEQLKIQEIYKTLQQ